jgi:hypothetical protein
MDPEKNPLSKYDLVKLKKMMGVKEDDEDYARDEDDDEGEKVKAVRGRSGVTQTETRSLTQNLAESSSDIQVHGPSISVRQLANWDFRQ